MSAAKWDEEEEDADKDIVVTVQVFSNFPHKSRGGREKSVKRGFVYCGGVWGNDDGGGLNPSGYEHQELFAPQCI